MSWFVALLLTLTGPVLIIAGIPLMRRRVRPNPWYGVRTRDTLADEAVWYAVNAKGGRDLVAIGAIYLALLLAVQLVARGLPDDMRVLLPVGVLLAGLAVSTARRVRDARRMRRARRGAE